MPSSSQGFSEATKSLITSVKMAWSVLGAVLMLGIWVGTIQADVNDKAETADVQAKDAAMVEILKRIEEKVDKVDEKVDKVDERQRSLSQDVAELKAKVKD